MKRDKLEPVVILLFTGMIFFSGVLIFCEYQFPMDGQVFQVFSGLLTGFAGAFFMRTKPKGSDDPDNAVITSVVSKHIEPEVKVEDKKDG